MVMCKKKLQITLRGVICSFLCKHVSQTILSYLKFITVYDRFVQHQHKKTQTCKFSLFCVQRSRRNASPARTRCRP